MLRLQQVGDALIGLIDKSKLEKGERLPPERELMNMLGVGRSTIREVIGRLQALGVVETRKGSGTYLVHPVNSATIRLPLLIRPGELRDVLLQTLEVRRGIETEASALAALRRTDADLINIEQKLVEMERVHLLKGTSGVEDLAFHLAVYDATHNPLFHQILEQMREAFERFWDTPFNRPDFARRSFPFHRTLFEAIAAGDSDRARGETLKILAVTEEDIKEMSKGSTELIRPVPFL